MFIKRPNFQIILRKFRNVCFTIVKATPSNLTALKMANIKTTPSGIFYPERLTFFEHIITRNYNSYSIKAILQKKGLLLLCFVLLFHIKITEIYIFLNYYFEFEKNVILLVNFKAPTNFFFSNCMVLISGKVYQRNNGRLLFEPAATSQKIIDNWTNRCWIYRIFSSFRHIPT